MAPLWIAVTFIAIVSFFTVQTMPERQEFYHQVETDKDVVSILAYKKGVIRYLEINPTFTGTIAASTLGTFWPTGYTYTTGTWDNFIDTNGTLYIYSLFDINTASASNNTLLSNLYDMSQGSEMLGTKISGNFVSYTGSVNWPIPTVIPNNRLVIIGK